MNQCHFLGNLTRDPEVKTSANGLKLANFSLAVRRNKDSADFFDFVCFGEVAEFVEKWLGKGKPAIVHARANQDTWDDKESGKKRSKVKFIANSVEFVNAGGKKKDDETSNEKSDSGSDGDDIPF